MDELTNSLPSTISANPVDNDPVKPESLQPEELQKILQAKARVIQLTTVAEKAVAEARVAELEAQNLILRIYNFYQLNQSVGDTISENGLINRVRNNPEKNNGQ